MMEDAEQGAGGSGSLIPALVSPYCFGSLMGNLNFLSLFLVLSFSLLPYQL